ncbi:E3 ubiquitin-protein transferase MAEA-like [Diaphorina citri]|uniref:E3 ubiquitin-protein transferase MAEA n=1 Tax=Diaphorina citri TaxID=121845 RepID=A0A3Q0JD81_DIACI|nr:E3 ubiquitin-protein transferase MAEA-like [Diaphorina citri]
MENIEEKLIALVQVKTVLYDTSDTDYLYENQIQVPYETLNKKFHAAQKTIDREVSYVQSAANELEKTIASSEKPLLTEVTRLLGEMFERLEALKKKLGIGFIFYIFTVLYETLNKKFHAAQKTIDREVSYVQSAANELEKTIASSEKPPLTKVTRLLGKMFERLQALKKKAGESIGEELQVGHVLKCRIEHLKEHSGNVLSNTSQSEASINRKKTRLDRMLIEYLLLEERLLFNSTETCPGFQHHRFDQYCWTLLCDVLRVPYEILNKKFRAVQKTIDREVSYVSLTKYGVCLKACDMFQSTQLYDPLCDLFTISNLLTSQSEALINRKKTQLDRMLIEYLLLEERLLFNSTETCPVRSTSQSEASIIQWKKTRLDRMLIEYFLRKGYYSTAQKLAQASNITDLTNIDVFLVSHQIAESLQQHETSKCLTWCHENKSKLRKLRSGLEFNMRMQEFIELVSTAIYHIARFLNHELFVVKLHFTYYSFRLAHGLDLIKVVSSPPGLSALKTPQCSSEVMETRNKSCPVCMEPFNTLAKSLPYARCNQSRLVCSISGLQFNEYNQPMVLPNGYVYGEQVGIWLVIYLGN